MPQNIGGLVLAASIMLAVLAGIAALNNYYSLNIKARTVGRGQHGTARWATRGEIARTYAQVDFTPERWREGRDLPDKQGIVVGCKNRKHTTTALVDTGDVHAIMIGAAGVGKTAYWLYPCLEYALASGMSFASTDTKGDVFRNYAGIARDCYGYRVSVIDLRNPTKSDGFNLLHLVNKYADLYKQEGKLAYKARAEKYAKIISKTIIMSGGDSASYGQNAFFYIGTTDSADEWAEIWRRDSNPAAMDKCFGGSLRGMNKYELEEQLAKLDEIILEYAQRKDNRETKDCAIPMDKKVLGEFLRAGHVFAGELFPEEETGISLGANLSPMMANHVLDGLQGYV